MSKRIVLCADGTWNTPHGPAEMPNDTNVRKLFLLLNDDDSQLKYYDSGVGTDGSPFEHFFGGTMGDGLFQKVQDGYAFLSYVWDPGDEIYLIGFSRGAYTARSLGGMIAGFGVPTKNLDNQTVAEHLQRVSDDRSGDAGGDEGAADAAVRADRGEYPHGGGVGYGGSRWGFQDSCSRSSIRRSTGFWTRP